MNKRIKVKRNRSLVAKYTEMAIEKISEMGAGWGIYAYRGQANAEWKVVSAAYRRLENFTGEPPRMEDFINYHEQELINPARMSGYDLKDGRILGDLELLAEMQHFGAATCLIDFTRNFQAALWFACQTESDGVNGKIFIMNINDIQIFSILNQSDLGKNIKSILEFKNLLIEKDTSKNQISPTNPSYWYWAPHGMNQRILKQDSLFIFGSMEIDSRHVDSITVQKEDKYHILIELESIGISKESLFQDFHGFASRQGYRESIPMKNQSADALFRAGNMAYQRKDLDSALQFYNVAIHREPDNPTFYVNRAAIKSKKNQSGESVSDFEKSSILRASNTDGNTHPNMENHISAIKDLNKAIDLDDSNPLVYLYRGLSYAKMGNHDDAIKDITQSINIDPKQPFTYYCRSWTQMALGNREEAIADMERAFELAEIQGNGEYILKIHEILNQISGKE